MRLMTMALVAGFLAAPAMAADGPPPPHLRAANPDGTVYGVAPGTAAPDGVGVTVKSAVWAGEYNTDVLTYVPWDDLSTVKPLQAGASIPEHSVVRAANGQPFDLNEAVRKRPTLLVFYRGGWCPYCNAHLRELQASEPALTRLGYQILAISTDTPEEIRSFNADSHLSYTLLSDTKLDVAARFGLRFKVSAQYLAHLGDEGSRNMLAKNGGYLPTPAAYVVDRRGVIRFAYANNNYSVRVSQPRLLQAAREALKE